jgi:formylglycine-generating enzyme
MNKTRRADKAAKPVRRRNRLKIVVCIAILLAGLSFWKFGIHHIVHATQLPHATTAQTLPKATSGFAPTVENKNTPVRPAPPAMAWIPGGEFSMGAQDPPTRDRVGMQATLDSRPVHRVYVDGFWMDKLM